MHHIFLARNTHEEASMAIHYHQHPYRLLLDPSDITAPPTTKLNSSYDGEANFDGNMVIVLAALLCALLCAVGLNSIVRCFLRCSGTTIGRREEAVVRLAAAGIEKEVLSRIPAVIYTAAMHILATDCPICLGEFVEGEDIRFFPRCNHGFHVKCIDTWLVLQSSCPTCRRPLLEHSSVSSADHVSIQIS